MPKHRRNRSTRIVGVLWILSLFVAGTFAASLGGRTARANDAWPNADSVGTHPAVPIPCSGLDSAGPLPAGTQSIGGLVTDTSATPVPDMRVYIESPGDGHGSVVTNAEGRYVFEGLGDATYFLSFYDETGTYQSSFYAGAGVALSRDDATAVVLSGGGAADIDAALPAETLSTISGRVTDSDGQGVAGAQVSARGRYFGGLVSCALTESDGSYELVDVRAGAYTGEATADGYPPAGPADPNIVVPPDDATVDFQFPQVYALGGLVTDGDGAPVDNISVSASRVGGGGSGFGSSAGDGSFELAGLVAGLYVIQYQDSSGLGRYRTGYYGGANVWVETEAAAVAVAVPGGPIALRVVPAPQVTGTITAPDAPPGSINVGLCDEFEANCFSAYADGGPYSVGVLVPGTYIARVFDYSGTYPSGGYIGAGGTIVLDANDALSIIVDDNDVGLINATLPAGGRISVNVTVGGVTSDDAYVQVCRDEFVCPDAIGTSGGAGTSPAMFVGTYYVQATTDFEHWYWYVSEIAVSAVFADAAPIAVTANATTSATLVLPASGTFTDDGGPGVVDDVTVALDDGTGTGNTPVTVTFADVTASGTTSLTVTDFGDPIPSGFQLGLPATYFDISTTAVFVAPITVCISYAGMSFSYEGGIQLWHYDSSIPGWDPITTEVRTSEQVVCGETNTLSPFVIVEPTPSFSGFFQPVDNLALNRAKAGAGVPVKFSLGGNFGLNIFAAGYPSVSLITCPGASVDAIEQTVSIGSSHLVYDASKDQYVYLFKTAKAWAGTCQQLVLVFIDGTTLTADFTFTK